jgi:hypothetical protein
VNVWQDTTLRNCNVPQKLVQLLIVADGELEMTRDDTGLLVVTGSIASKFEDFSSEIFEHGCKVDWGTSTDTLSVVALSQETVDTADGECEASFRGPAVKGKCQLDWIGMGMRRASKNADGAQSDASNGHHLKTKYIR